MSRVEILVIGHIVNPVSDKKAELYRDGAMLLTEKMVRGEKVYKIKMIDKKVNVFKVASSVCQVLDYTDHLIIPPFFDMHFHWVQDAVRTMPKDSLLSWLEKYTFPAEAKFQNKKYAKKEAKVFFQRLVSCGTLGGACYSSIHEHALEYAVDEILGDFVIGNVLMTMNSPKNLTQTHQEAVSIVNRLASKYKKKYALTPRFAIATDPKTMFETSKIAKKSNSFIQTHLSETKDEIEFVKNLYKDQEGFSKVKTYTDVYKKVGLLGKKTIMGHGIYLSQEELSTLAKTNTAIAHCPTSNASKQQLGLGSGLFDFKRAEKAGVRWALASDIGGGPFLSMLDVMRSFVDQNKKANVKGATYVKALHRATQAGAEILDVGSKKGNFSIGKEASFLVLGKVDINSGDNAEKVLAKVITKYSKKRKMYDQVVEKVFYQGQLVFNKNRKV